MPPGPHNPHNTGWDGGGGGRRGRAEPEPFPCGVLIPSHLPRPLPLGASVRSGFQFRFTRLPGLEKLQAGGLRRRLRSYFTTSRVAPGVHSLRSTEPPDPKHWGPCPRAGRPLLVRRKWPSDWRMGSADLGFLSRSWVLCANGTFPPKSGLRGSPLCPCSIRWALRSWETRGILFPRLSAPHPPPQSFMFGRLSLQARDSHHSLLFLSFLKYLFGRSGSQLRRAGSF